MRSGGSLESVMALTFIFSNSQFRSCIFHNPKFHLDLFYIFHFPSHYVHIWQGNRKGRLSEKEHFSPYLSTFIKYVKSAFKSSFANSSLSTIPKSVPIDCFLSLSCLELCFSAALHTW